MNRLPPTTPVRLVRLHVMVTVIDASNRLLLTPVFIGGKHIRAAQVIYVIEIACCELPFAYYLIYIVLWTVQCC